MEQEQNKPELVGVERPAIDWLVELGYTHIEGKQVQQALKTEAPILEDVLTEELERLNDWLKEVPSGAQRAIKLLRDLWFEQSSDLMLANQAFWEKALFHSDMQLKDAEGNPKSIRFIDQTQPLKNKFHVVDQYVGTNANGDLFKPDLMLFVNGLPLAVVECKSSSVKLEKGIAQIDGYINTFKPHFAFNMVCAAINRTDARYGAIYAPAQFYLRYKFDAKRADEKQQLEAIQALLGKEPTEQDKLLWALFEPSRFVRLVCFYPLYEVENGSVIKKLPRYQQWRAVEKTLQRVSGQDPKYLGKQIGGTVWHTQGSGKSLTMALLARLLRADVSGFNNPSVLVLTDRTDLDQQIHGTFNHVGLSALKADSVAGLESMLGNDYGAIFTSTVQKFQERDGKPIQTAKESEEAGELAGKSRIRRELRKQANGHDTFWIVKEENQNFGKFDSDGELLKAKWKLVSEDKVDLRVLSNKANFFVLVDEAHRSQYGFLAAFMRASLPNAKFIAFTGTPLAKEDKSTLKEFGGAEYIDTYRLDEAVADGATLPIKYLEGMSDWGSDGQLQKEFEDKFGQEPPERQKALKQKLLKERRNAKERVEQNSCHLVDHFLSSVKAKGFKGMLVCNGREQAVKYKDTLDAIMAERKEEGLATFESRVVISLASMTESRTGASEQRKAYQAGNKKNLETIEERIRREERGGLTPVCVPTPEIPTLTGELFKLPYGDESENKPDDKAKVNNIGLIIVSDMLLTGWDAPIVNTLYLDKPLKEHTLLQAIARVNRTRKGKTAGYIMDYYGVVDALDEALKIFGGDVQPEQVWTDVEAELPKLKSAMQQVLDILPNSSHPVKQAENYKADADLYLDPDVRLDVVEDFLYAVAVFNHKLDIVLPDQRGAPFKPYFKAFNEIKLALRQKLPEAADKGRVTEAETALLKEMLDEHVEASPVKSLLDREISILDAADMDLLRRQKGVGASAIVMKNQLKHTIQTGKRKDPGFFGDLEELLGKLLEDEKAGRIEQAQFLEQLELFSQQIRDKDTKAGKMGLTTASEQAVFNYLKGHVPEQEAEAWTKGIFGDDELSAVLLSDLWKKQTDIHAAMKDSVRRILRGLSGWKVMVARQHTNEIFQLLLNN